jgi:hypothetical protein
MAAADGGWCRNESKHPAHMFIFEGKLTPCWGVD